MRIVLINPNLVTLRHDPFTTGIVYMPIGLVSVATALAKAHGVRVIDAFGEAPRRVRARDRYLLSGLAPEETVARIPAGTEAIFLYADRLTNHVALLELLRAVNAAFPNVPKILLENTQAVTAYALSAIKEELLAAGADFVLIGEAEETAGRLLEALASGVPPLGLPGVAFRHEGACHFTEAVPPAADLDRLAFPDWGLIPLANYWGLRYAHGPFETDRYLPILTSRGCPYPCRFCVIPTTNRRRWRGRSAKNVVDEMETNLRRFGVSEFHLEDVNPTVSDGRIRELCREILARKLPILWKIAAGTKVETIRDETTLQMMRDAGCAYISISPESGSPRVMRLMDKPFNFPHALRLVRDMKRLGITSQACFVLGFPGEEPEDRRATAAAVRELIEAGVDDVTLSIVTPVPGAAIFSQFEGFDDYSQLNFSPTWRADYRELARFRRGLYAKALWWKLRAAPLTTLRQPFAILRRRFRSKMTMAIYRGLRVAWSARSADKQVEDRGHGQDGRNRAAVAKQARQ